MTQDEIIEIANEVGINQDADTLCRYEGWIEPLKDFAKLVEARTLSNIDPSKFMSYQEGMEVGRIAEREACAKLIEKYPYWLGANAKQDISAAIRARGNT